ncbi:MAG: MFS transporter [Chloroflexi bacterium]|nr:MFS transporter [Chloroflexota bacterium]
MNRLRGSVASPAALSRRRPVRTLFLGITLSRLGESLTVVSLIWIVFQETQSAQGVAVAQFAYTALIPVGGLFVGAVLDRYRVVPVMVLDAFLKVGVVLLAIAAALAGVGVVPAALLAALYLGLAWMVGGAGLPTLIAGTVAPDGHPRANLADSLTWSLTAFVGPILAGILIETIGPIAGLAAGAACALGYGLLLWSIQANLMSHLPPATIGALGIKGITSGFRLVFRSPLLLSLTGMFTSLNAIQTVYTVALPIYATQVLGGGAAEYTLLLSIRSVGEMAGTILGRWTAPRIGVGRAIVLAVLSGGALILPLVAITSVPVAVVAILVAGLVGNSQGPWIQVIRMRVIPPEMRSRAFGSIRTMTNSLAPVAALTAGVIVPLVGVPAIFGIVAAGWIATGIGLASVRELRESAA